MLSPDTAHSIASTIPGASVGAHNSVVAPSKAAVAAAHKQQPLIENSALCYIRTGAYENDQHVKIIVEAPQECALDYTYQVPPAANTDISKRRVVCVWDAQKACCWIVGTASQDATTITLSSTKRMAMLVGRNKQARVYVPRETKVETIVRDLGRTGGLLCMQFVGYAGWRTKENSKSFFEGWDQFPTLVRYCGYVDMDLPESAVKSILQGRRPLLAGNKARVYTDTAMASARQQLKQELADFYKSLEKNEPGITVGSALKRVPAIEEVCDNAIAIAKATGGVALFSGNKGAHVLFRERELFFRVVSEQRFDLPTVEKLRAYLIEKVGKESKVGKALTEQKDLLDCSVYRRSTGIAPRGFCARKHAKRLWPLQLWPLKKGDTCVGKQAKLFQDETYSGSRTLHKSIIGWVRWVWSTCPSEDNETVAKVETDVMRKKSKKSKVNGKCKVDSDALQKLVASWQAQHGVKQWNGCNGFKGLPRRLSVQTDQFLNREFGATQEQVEQVVEDVIARYFDARQTRDFPEKCNVPLNERYGDRSSEGHSMRLVLDIDGHALNESDFRGLQAALTQIVGREAEDMVVCSTTDPTKINLKWHIAFPKIVLMCGNGRFTLLCEALERALAASEDKGLYWHRNRPCVDSSCAEYKKSRLLDCGVYNTYLRTPLVPKRHGGSGAYCYVPTMMVRAEETQTWTAEVWTNRAQLNEETEKQMRLAARMAFACPAASAKPLQIPKLEDFLKREQTKRKQEIDELAKRAKRQKTVCVMSPRSQTVEVACTALMTSEFCIEATQRYLAHPHTLCPAADAQIPASDFKVRFENAQSAWVDYTAGKWQLCECNMGEHKGDSRVCWHVYVSPSGFCRIGQYCQSDKCKAMDPEKRNKRAPAYTIRVPPQLAPL